MSGRMQCCGCADVVVLASTVRQITPNKWLVFCLPCAATFWTEDNWTLVEQAGPQDFWTRMKCQWCDALSLRVHVNRALIVPLAFCFGCKARMRQQRNWEEMRRGGEDTIDFYAPRVIVPGRVTGGS